MSGPRRLGLSDFAPALARAANADPRMVEVFVLARALAAQAEEEWEQAIAAIAVAQDAARSAHAKAQELLDLAEQAARRIYSGEAA